MPMPATMMRRLGTVQPEGRARDEEGGAEDGAGGRCRARQELPPRQGRLRCPRVVRCGGPLVVGRGVLLSSWDQA